MIAPAAARARQISGRAIRLDVGGVPARAYLLAAFLAANGIVPVASADLMPSTFMAFSVVTAGWKATTVRSISATVP